MVKIVVLDTNVLISSIFWDKGNSHKIVALAIQQKITNFTSAEMLDELARVLRKKFNQPEDKIEDQLALVANYSQITGPKIKVNVVKEDPSDNKVLECALSCNAEFIVTGNNHLLKLGEYRGIKIVKPAEFIKKVADYYRQLR